MDSNKKCVSKTFDIWVKSIIEREVILPFNSVGNNLKDLITLKLRRDIEGKCSVDGYIRNNSINIISYSSGLLESDLIKFNVSIECDICNPVEGMSICVKALNITKAGIRGVYPKGISPVEVLLPRDWHYNSKDFSSIKEEDIMIVKVIGQRYELGDDKIQVMGEIENKAKIKVKQPSIKIK
jgi:hypothetical protein